MSHLQKLLAILKHNSRRFHSLLLFFLALSLSLAHMLVKQPSFIVIIFVPVNCLSRSSSDRLLSPTHLIPLPYAFIIYNETKQQTSWVEFSVHVCFLNDIIGLGVAGLISLLSGRLLVLARLQDASMRFFVMDIFYFISGKSNEDVYVVAKYDYMAQGVHELDIHKNERLLLIDDSKNWWKVQNCKTQSGFVPSNYVKREKPSIFDSIKRRVKKKSDFGRTTNTTSPPTAAIPNNGPKVGNAPNSATTANENKFTNSTALVKYNYEAQQSDEISLTKSGRVVVMEKSNDGWWRGEFSGKIGWFPSNYVLEEFDDASFFNSHTYAAADASANRSFSNCAGGSPSAIAHRSVLDVVVALYSFSSQNDEELNFQKGERLEVIDRPVNDPEWWRARNASGDTGLVPKNYVQVVPKDSGTPEATDQNGLQNLNERMGNVSVAAGGDGEAKPTLVGKTWYHGGITRNRCDQLLNEYGANGDFIVRDSETNVSTILKWLLR